MRYPLLTPPLLPPGASGYPARKQYRGNLQRHATAFCKAKKCNPAARREIEEMVHEDMHASAGWYRIFPTGLSTAFTCAAYPRSRTSARLDRLRCISPARYAIQIEPVYENTLTPLDWLMFEWIERRWAPKHHHNREGTVVVDENAKGRFF